MSAQYRMIISIANSISKEFNYNWWGEKIGQALLWILLISSTFALFADIQNNQNSIVFLIILGVIWLFYRFYVNKISNIMCNELTLAEEIIDRTNINLTYVKKLINETETSIKNARRVAQWAVGGILTIVIFIGGQLITSVSNAVIATLPNNIETLDVLNSIFLSSNDLVSGSFEIISTFTVLIVGALAMVYAVLQIHTFSNRSYLRLFRDIEYQLILKN
ncbi:hypothetical protein [Lactococcus lactis]|uniref:hypothetical protein n=1 Tax=Lactococcus lactis TaxID=1358 RepID=UPI0028928477|nr:hypothetical protein [Lactococcus lactis]MDT2904811.1 hypothetical protein [Lactococcus lactis]MDT2910586.1 hypothetical protein [Lactococcus lactis]MDT2931669.1 hypothetical protein [Lactococcus lactis]MDT2937066.1 hypothetical protein [Lactococcus lactis]